VKKYWESIPLNRQNEALERLGLSMPSASMSDQVQWATDLLRPIWRLLMADVLRATVMHVDGTSLPVRDRDHPNGIVTGSLWGYVGEETSALYLYTSTGKKTGQAAGEMGPEDSSRYARAPWSPMPPTSSTRASPAATSLRSGATCIIRSGSLSGVHIPPPPHFVPKEIGELRVTIARGGIS
jgi:Transposase IS66 family